MRRFIVAGATIAAFIAHCGAAAVTFEGNTVYTAQKILRTLRFYDVRLQDSFGITDADDAAYFIRLYYFEQGFPDADVTYEFSPNPSRVVFRISEGEQIHVGDISFEGNSTLPVSRLKEIVNSAIRQNTRAVFGRLRYMESALASARAKILEAFIQEGHLSAKVEALPAEREGQKANLTFRIDEGPTYRIGEMEFEGTDVFSSQELKGELNDLLELPYRPDRELIYRLRLLQFLKNRGYFEAEVHISVDVEEHPARVNLRFFLTPGHRFTIGEMVVNGNRKTWKGAILRRFDVHPGQVYSAKAMDAGTGRLWYSGAFSDVSEKVEKIAPDKLRIVLNVEEGPAKSVRTTVGYSEWEGAFGNIVYTDRNLFGSLDRLTVNGYLSMKSKWVLAEFANPRFLNTPWVSSVSGFYAYKDLPAYTATQYGGILGLERRYDLQSLTGFRFQYVWKATTNTTVIGESAQYEDPYTVGSISLRQTLDRRNDILSPMKGYFLQNETTFASPGLLGDLSYVRFDSQMTYYLPLKKITSQNPFVPFMIFNHRAGLLLPYGNTSFVPIQERFFLGGPDTVRSYQLYGLGPKDNSGTPLGGLAYLLGNIELQMPVWKNFYVAAFTDIGNLASEIQDFTFSDTRVGVGLGLRVYTPLGAIRLDYGHTLNPGPGDPFGAWNFGFGFTF